jgi:hypothetical protein
MIRDFQKLSFFFLFSELEDLNLINHGTTEHKLPLPSNKTETRLPGTREFITFLIVSFPVFSQYSIFLLPYFRTLNQERIFGPLPHLCTAFQKFMKERV